MQLRLQKPSWQLTSSSLHKGLLLLCAWLLIFYPQTLVANGLLTNSLLANNLPTKNTPTESRPEIHLGILDWNSQQELGLDFWQPTLTALQQLPYKLKVSYFELDSLATALAKQELDYVITNPGHYLELAQTYALAPLATLNNADFMPANQVIGSVVWVKAERTDLNTWQNLRGQKMGAVSLDAFGGFQIIWDELLQQGLNPWLDIDSWQLTGFPMQQLFQLLDAGEIDGLVARSCLAETLAAKGLLQLENYKALGAKQPVAAEHAASVYPCQLSSQLYPDWPFLATNKPSRAQKLEVIQALFGLGQTAKQHSASQWSAALSYQPVASLFQRLKIGPFVQQAPSFSAWAQQKIWYLLAATFLIILLLAYLVRTSLLMRNRSQAVIELMQASQLQQQELEHLARFAVAGELAAGLAHEINQPLTAINNYAQGSLRLLQGMNTQACKQQPALLTATSKISAQAQRAAAIINNLRSFIRPEKSSSQLLDPALAITASAQFLEANLKQQQVSLKIKLEQPLPQIWANKVELIQILLNLLTNALNAMRQQQGGKIFVSAYVSEAENLLLIEVQDQGPGLNQQQLEQAFMPFFTTNPQGLGLGLSLCRSLAKAQGAKLSLESNQQGACARLEWPLAQATT